MPCILKWYYDKTDEGVAPTCPMCRVDLSDMIERPDAPKANKKRQAPRRPNPIRARAIATIRQLELLPPMSNRVSDVVSDAVADLRAIVNPPIRTRSSPPAAATAATPGANQYPDPVLHRQIRHIRMIIPNTHPRGAIRTLAFMRGFLDGLMNPTALAQTNEPLMQLYQDIRQTLADERALAAQAATSATKSV